MKLFKRRKETPKDIIKNDIGEEIHVYDGPLGEVRVKDYNPTDYLYHGEQWCPNCKIQTINMGGYFECPNCGWSITETEAEDGEGFSSLKATYEEDFGYWAKDYSNEDDWDVGEDTYEDVY